MSDKNAPKGLSEDLRRRLEAWLESGETQMQKGMARDLLLAATQAEVEGEGARAAALLAPGLEALERFAREAPGKGDQQS